MCIIAYVPKEISITKETLKNCFDNNSDGAGFMYSNGTEVVIQKGFMTFEPFFEAWSHIPEKYERVAHFRIATAGKISEGICHPFPVVEKFNDMKRTKTHCFTAIAHNGVLSSYSPKGGITAEYSDTMLFNQLVLYPLKDMLDKTAVQYLIEETGSRFAIMWPEKVSLIGNFEQKDGCFFSNGTFKYSKVSYPYGDEDWVERYYKNYGKSTTTTPAVTTGNTAKKTTKTTYTKMMELAEFYNLICFENVPKHYNAVNFIIDLERRTGTEGYIEPDLVCQVEPGVFMMADTELIYEGDEPVLGGYTYRMMEARDLSKAVVRNWIEDLWLDQAWGFGEDSKKDETLDTEYESMIRT